MKDEGDRMKEEKPSSAAMYGILLNKYSFPFPYRGKVVALTARTDWGVSWSRTAIWDPGVKALPSAAKPRYPLPRGGGRGGRPAPPQP